MNKLTVSVVLALAAPISAFWRLPCKAPVLTGRVDPIINPGKPSGHVHTIMGGNAFSFNMDYDQTQNSTCSSCTVTGDNSNYWVPTLWYHAQNGSFISVEQNGGGLIYYLQRTGHDGEPLKAFPRDFRMVAGDPFARNFTGDNAANAISYACLDYNANPTPETHAFPTRNCPDGLRAQVFFPSCWDGVNTDSDDHKSHMAYPIQGNDAGSCPETHPVRLISIFYEVIWKTDKFANDWYGDQNSQPFIWSTGDPTGYGYHGDFVNGWNVDLLQRAVDECTNLSGKVEDCPLFKLIPDDQAEGCKLLPHIDEPTSGILDALPGCNAVQPGPARALKVVGDCKDNATISSQPTSNFFTDMIGKKNWKYLGCGSDKVGDHTLTKADHAADDMTIESCIDFCKGKGYSIAGLEYARECYCGNNIPAERMPIPGVPGNCAMKCMGDSSETCGGPALLSLYQNCAGQPSCENVSFDPATAKVKRDPHVEHLARHKRGHEA